MAEEQLTLQVVWEESIEEQEALSNYKKIPIEILGENAHLAMEQGLDDPLYEQTTHCLMLQVFNYCHLLSIFPCVNLQMWV